MLFSYNWIKELMPNVPEPKALATLLTMAGAEVEGLSHAGRGITNVVIAEVVTIGAHPNADKLSLCAVKTNMENFSIVCGAKNMKVGDRVALALVGADLPGGMKIKKSKIRGIESQGMMCSEVELGLKDTSDGIMILPKDAPLGANFLEYAGLNDYLLEVNVTPNRADLLSVKGLCREISALTGLSVKEETPKLNESGADINSIASVTIAADVPCRRYSARVIKGVKIGPSPDAVQKRLIALGFRPVNNVVDVTNYIQVALGQPLHAFDLKKISGAGVKEIIVRNAAAGEAIKTIDNKDRALDAGMLVIADSNGPIAVAGVMGGAGSEVADDTTDILLESAWFDPSSVRLTARKLALSSESSYRFERGVDIEGVTNALDAAAAMICNIAGGVAAKGLIDVYPEKFSAEQISFDSKRASVVLGSDVSMDEAEKILSSLGLNVARSGDALRVIPASFRWDIRSEIDLIEEVARVRGYDKVPADLPAAALVNSDIGRAVTLKREIKKILTEAGFFEAVNYSFVNEAMAAPSAVRLTNPLSADMAVLRTTLLPSLLANLTYNLARKNENPRLFEVAPIFLPTKDKQPIEAWKVAGVMSGRRAIEAWNTQKDMLDFYDLKGVVELLLKTLGIVKYKIAQEAAHAMLHPGKSASIKTGDNKDIGVFGELHPDECERLDLTTPAFVFEFDLKAIIDAQPALGPGFVRLPKFPESTRDVALILDRATPYAEILSAVKGIDTKLIEKVEVFDVYYGDNIPQGKKSVALRIIYRSLETTLTNEQVEETHAKVVGELLKRFSAQLRA